MSKIVDELHFPTIHFIRHQYFVMPINQENRVSLWVEGDNMVLVSQPDILHSK